MPLNDKGTLFWLGAVKEQVKWLFLLPNQPELPVDGGTDFLTAPDVPLLIESNGNHWRKIFTIMAKLIAPADDDWRFYRDARLFERCAIVFDTGSLPDQGDMACCLDDLVVFVVGHGFRDEIPIAHGASVVGEKQQAFFADGKIWCPYLDYRQFPNALIAELRDKALQNTLI